jgi:hypothetical protein
MTGTLAASADTMPENRRTRRHPQRRSTGVKPDVVYAWARWGHIPARRGDAGRLWIDFTPDLERACLQRIASSYKLPDDIKAQAAQRLERKAG